MSLPNLKFQVTTAVIRERIFVSLDDLIAGFAAADGTHIEIKTLTKNLIDIRKEREHEGHT